MRPIVAILGVIVALGLFALIVGAYFISAYNDLQRHDEQVLAGWSEVLNQYQRRADLVPNLVNSVKGYAAHESDVLTRVTEARAGVGKIDAAGVLENPEAFARFEQAQQSMSGALSRLLVVAEQYPQLKADATFRDLMAQLEGTENRITVARNRYIKTVQEYNLAVRTLPRSFIAGLIGMKTRPNFSVQNEEAVSRAPEVKF